MSRAAITIVGIDMGTHATRVVVSAVTESGNPQLLGVGTSASRGLRSGYITNIQQASKSLRAAINDAQKNTGMQITEAILAIGGVSLRAEHIATTVEVTHHSAEVTEADITRALDVCEDILLSRHSNVRVIHRIPLKYKLDGQLCLGKPIGLTGKKLSIKALFITALEHHIEDLISAAHDAGITVVDVAAAPLVASVPVLTHNDRKAGAALLDIGSETSSLMVFNDGYPISMEIFPIGSTDITNDLALGFQISLDDADALKKGTLQPSKARKYAKSRVDDIVSARLSDIAELVERHLVSIKKNHLLPAGIVITGGGANIEILPQILKASLRLPIRVAADGLTQQSKQKAFDASWYVAYGLCAWAMNDGNVRLTQPNVLVNVLKNIGGKIKGSFRHLLP
jgi:cell division protein FtsA